MIRVYRVILLDWTWFTSLEVVVFLFFFDDVHMGIKWNRFFLVFESFTILVQTAEMFELPYIGFDSRQRDTPFLFGNKVYGTIVFLLWGLNRISTSLELTVLNDTENRRLLSWWNLLLVFAEASYFILNFPYIDSFICCVILLRVREIWLLRSSLRRSFKSWLSSWNYIVWFLSLWFSNHCSPQLLPHILGFILIGVLIMYYSLLFFWLQYHLIFFIILIPITTLNTILRWDCVEWDIKLKLACILHEWHFYFRVLSL